MPNPKHKTAVLIWAAIIILSYFAHRFAFEWIGIRHDAFSYSLLSLYLFFGLFSVAILLTVFRVSARNFDLVGMSFLIITTLKMVAFFVFVHPILKSISSTAPIEKINFFGMFIVFLSIETIVTIVILNEKQ
ncbi:hypothetical protein [Flavobacterium sp. N2013]|uniref:hypothetical protein n=1 Tax=Flavobacterium sp. N2013 TaxID=2986828 RepID=UPI0022248ECE|nr:hypothetical protein [Flavobacterium sp. N2013]